MEALPKGSSSKNSKTSSKGKPPNSSSSTTFRTTGKGKGLTSCGKESAPLHCYRFSKLCRLLEPFCVFTLRSRSMTECSPCIRGVSTFAKFMPGCRVNHRGTLARILLREQIAACCNHLPHFPWLFLWSLPTTSDVEPARSRVSHRIL